MPEDDPYRSKGVQSVEVGMRVLRAFCSASGPMTLKEISHKTSFPPAKVHRYLASLVAAGMVDHRRTGTYDLGPAAAEIGIAALARVDPVNRAADALPALVDRLGHTAMLSVWGSAGPTVVRWERARPPLVTALGVGAVLPLMTSATGLVFLCWGPDRLLPPTLSETERAQVLAQKTDMRAAGLAEAEETFIPGLFALAAPVLDMQGEAVAAVTLISTDNDLVAPHSEARRVLKEVFPSQRPSVGGEKAVSQDREM